MSLTLLLLLLLALGLSIAIAVALNRSLPGRPRSAPRPKAAQTHARRRSHHASDDSPEYPRSDRHRAEPDYAGVLATAGVVAGIAAVADSTREDSRCEAPGAFSPEADSSYDSGCSDSSDSGGSDSGGDSGD